MVDKQINLLYGFLDELGGIERLIAFQANVLKKDSIFTPKIFFIHIANGKEKLLNEQLGLVSDISIMQPVSNLGKIGNFIRHMLFPNKLYKLPGVIVSHDFLSSRMALKRKEYGYGNYIFFAQHPPNFLYDRSWSWVNNFPRFVAYCGGWILGPLLRKWDKEATLGADVVYVNSQYTKKRIERIYNHPNVKIMFPPISEQFRVCHPDRRRIQKAILEDKGIKKDFIHMHGRMIKDKCPQYGVQAFSLIQNKDIDLVISGTIEEKEKLEALIKEKGINDKVHLLGRVSEEELLALYNHASCFLVTAPKEDWGLTQIEAMSCGTPAVAWADQAGPQEQIIPKVNGLLARPYDIIDMSIMIDRVLETNYNRAKVSKSVDKFKAKKIKEEFLDAVKEAALEYEYKYHA